MFVAKGVFRSCEIDDYKEGCLPDSGYSISWDIDFKGKTKEEIIEEIKEFHNVDDEALLIEGSKICVQLHEKPLHDRWITPSEEDIENWKEGKTKIYLVDYVYRLFKEESICVE